VRPLRPLTAKQKTAVKKLSEGDFCTTHVGFRKKEALFEKKEALF
jgi:hypothetical protein